MPLPEALLREVVTRKVQHVRVSDETHMRSLLDELTLADIDAIFVRVPTVGVVSITADSVDPRTIPDYKTPVGDESV